MSTLSTPILAHFGLTQHPFTKEISDDDLWLPDARRALVDEICEAVADRQSLSIVGEDGVGKTCVLRAVRRRLPADGFRLTYCHNVTLGRRDFYRQLCIALGIPPHATAAAVFFAVSTHVQDLGRDRIHPTFLLDEAHLLHQDTLDHLHILLNYEWDSRALLSLILVGLPELQERLALRRNRSLYSRLRHRILVPPMVADDSAEYLRLRLRRVGCDRELFAADAITALHNATGGSLRHIDRVASLALREAARRKRKTVDADTLEHVLDAGDARAIA